MPHTRMIQDGTHTLSFFSKSRSRFISIPAFTTLWRFYLSGPRGVGTKACVPDGTNGTVEMGNLIWGKDTENHKAKN
jgi:hypothetical protein